MTIGDGDTALSTTEPQGSRDQCEPALAFAGNGRGRELQAEVCHTSRDAIEDQPSRRLARHGAQAEERAGAAQYGHDYGHDVRRQGPPKKRGHAMPCRAAPDGDVTGETDEGYDPECRPPPPLGTRH